MQFPGASERVRLQEVVRGLINWLVSGLIEGTVEAAAGIRDWEAVREHGCRLARFSHPAAAGSAQLKRLLRTTVYESEQLAEARRESTGRIEALFEAFLGNLNLLPANYLEESAGETPHRLVCDYIAGMTDRYLIRTCEQMKLS
jgi:dGTPase